MNKYYTIGQFAKKAGTTVRTIRYYDTIGLLKPTKILSNGYRQYSEKDFLKLQKISTLQYLGFSLEEVFPMLMNENPQSDFKDSILLQIELVNKKINYLEGLRESLRKVNTLLDQGTVEWDRITDLIRLANEENRIIKSYQSVNNLLTRIKIHNRYTSHKNSWYLWLSKQINTLNSNRLLEIGCGNGELWKSSRINIRNREFFLTDINSDMLSETKNNLGGDFNYMVMDCESITFKRNYFDTVIVNHVLYYLNDLNKGIAEIHRVLNHEGILYCSAYSMKDMHEIVDLVRSFNSDIYLLENQAYEKFCLENGEKILSKFFSIIELREYKDQIRIDNSQALIDYIMSFPGNQNEIIGKNMVAFKSYIDRIIGKTGYFTVTKLAGVFICKK